MSPTDPNSAPSSNDATLGGDTAQPGDAVRAGAAADAGGAGVVDAAGAAGTAGAGTAGADAGGTDTADIDGTGADEAPTRQQRLIRKWGFPVGVIVVASLLLVAIVTTQGAKESEIAQLREAASRGGGSDADAGQGADAASDDPQDQRNFLRSLVKRDRNDPSAIGAENAPVGMIIFSDAQCGYCAQWITQTLPELERYLADGTLRIEWHDALLYGEDSARAGRAAWAAGKQHKFLEFQQALFAGGKPHSDSLTEAGLVEIARKIGLDTQAFTADLNSDQAKKRVNEGAQLARKLGLQGTPGFLIDGEPVMGAQPTPVFTEMIENAKQGKHPA